MPCSRSPGGLLGRGVSLAGGSPWQGVSLAGGLPAEGSPCQGVSLAGGLLSRGGSPWQRGVSLAEGDLLGRGGSHCRGSFMAFWCGLLVWWPSGVAFWFGGLLIEGSILLWPSGVIFCYGLLLWPSGKAFWYGVSSLLTETHFNQKAITEGHTRRP